MDSLRFARLQEVFAHARELAQGERADYLAKACEGDEELHREARELLEEDSTRRGDALDLALGHDEPLGPKAGPGPQRIGQYTILRICGSGGMGTVYEALQDTPKRRVALKVIRSESHRPELLRRFRRESEILAKLQHPCIAQIFEAGEFEYEGTVRPYFAMEFVEGRPLLDHAAQHSLTTPARIDMFLQVCEAVQYAHEQGVVHRDLKPDNIHIAQASGISTTPSKPHGQPKVLDFGVARLAGADADVTLATSAGQLLGSIPYMSPEQAAGDPAAIDARSDLYSLGVVLYELLTGRLPHDVKNRDLADALHAIRHDEPTRLGSVNSALRGDLETIVGKCLEKPLDRRYGSLLELIEDLRRYQSLEPIRARPPSTRYQLRKFAQRNRALVGGVLGTGLALVAGTIVAISFAVNAKRSADMAQQSEVNAQRAGYRASLAGASGMLESDPAYARRILTEVPIHMRGWEWHCLSSALSGFVLEFGEAILPARRANGSEGPKGMALLRDGSEVIALRTETQFAVWDTRTGERLQTIEAPGEVDSFTAAKDGSLVAAALMDGRIVARDPRSESSEWTTWHGQGQAAPAGETVQDLALDPSGRYIAFLQGQQLHFGRPGAMHVHPSWYTVFYPPDLAFSPDGTQLASLPDAIVWDVETGKRTLAGIPSTQGHWSIAYSPDGTRLAAGQLRREVRCYDIESGDLEVELFGHSQSVTHVAYGEADQLLSVSASDDTIRIWDLQRGETSVVLNSPGTSMAEFVGRDHILTLSNGRFRLWTLRNRRARELRGHHGRVFDAAFSGDGELLVTTAPWSDTIVWDFLSGTELFRLPAWRRENLAFDPSGQELLLGYAVEAVDKIPLVGGQSTQEIARAPKPRHSRRGAQLYIDGRPFESKDLGLQVYRTEHPIDAARPPRTFRDGTILDPGTPQGVTGSLDADSLATTLGAHPALKVGRFERSSFDGSMAELLVFDGALSDLEGAAVDAYLAERRTGKGTPLPPHTAANLTVHFRADTGSLELSDDGSVLGWKAINDAQIQLVPSGRPQNALRFEPATDDAPAQVRFESGYGVRRWLETPLPSLKDCSEITVCWLGSYDGAPSRHENAYTIGSVDLLFTRAGRDTRVPKLGTEICYSPDGRFRADVFALDAGGSLTVRDVQTGYICAHFEGHYFGVSFHPDSRRVAAAAHDGAVHVYDVLTHERVVTIDAHVGTCNDAAFSPDGKRLATCGNDNSLRIWDTDRWENLLELPGHDSYVRGLAWSADGEALVSVSGDKVVRVWDAMPRAERYALGLQQQALEDGIRKRVEEIASAAASPEDALAETRSAWPESPAHRRAAVRILARLHQPK